MPRCSLCLKAVFPLLLTVFCISCRKDGTVKADAGGDKQITMPLNRVVLDGRRSRVSHQGTYVWTIVDGPPKGRFSSYRSSITELAGLTQGTYRIELTVTAQGETSKDSVLLTVGGDPGKDSAVFYNIEGVATRYSVFPDGQWAEVAIENFSSHVSANSFRVYLRDRSDTCFCWELVSPNYNGDLYNYAVQNLPGELVIYSNHSLFIGRKYDVMIKWN